MERIDRDLDERDSAFASTVSGSDSVGAWDPVGTVVTVALTADVTDMLSQPSQNYGWMLKDSLEPGGGAGEQVDFSSKEGAHSPRLVIGYCAP